MKNYKEKNNPGSRENIYYFCIIIHCVVYTHIIDSMTIRRVGIIYTTGAPFIDEIMWTKERI